MDEISEDLLKQFLENSPLYLRKSYSRSSSDSLHVDGIEAYCEKCQLSRPFKDMRSRGSGAVGSSGARATPKFKSGERIYPFTCAQCRNSTIEIHVRYIVTEKSISLMKYGELPRKKMDRSPVLDKFFQDDAENLEKATVCFSSGYGIAAFAYYRRIVESNIDKLLELIKKDINETENGGGNIEALEKLKDNSPMSDKIKVANQALPKYLIPDGLNPLGSLYRMLSEGVHSLSDEECLERAKIIRECILYLVGELTSREKHRKQFSKLVGKMNA